MRPFISVVALVVAVDAHYALDRLVINDQSTDSWQYVRENTRAEKYMPTKFFNSFGTTPLDDDFRCNQGANSNAWKTQTAEVAPGTRLALQLAYGARIQHPGPTQVYMSRAPGLAQDYDGSGDWFKIAQDTMCGPTEDGLQDTDWCSWNDDRIDFYIPWSTPPGEYLVRAEHIGLHGAHVGEAEFYYSCAQIKVTGNGNGSPGPMAKIPGIYDNNDPAIRFNIYAGQPYWHFPGPARWWG